MAIVTFRYWAAARDAAGTAPESVLLTDAAVIEVLPPFAGG
jgi:molybdopterin converting factor small subunit